MPPETCLDLMFGVDFVTRRLVDLSMKGQQIAVNAVVDIQFQGIMGNIITNSSFLIMQYVVQCRLNVSIHC